jgi:hypothetical protein
MSLLHTRTAIKLSIDPLWPRAAGAFHVVTQMRVPGTHSVPLVGTTADSSLID